jgi:hypothetical protein
MGRSRLDIQLWKSETNTLLNKINERLVERYTNEAMINRLGIDECRLRLKLIMNGVELCVGMFRKFTNEKFKEKQ